MKLEFKPGGTHMAYYCFLLADLMRSELLFIVMIPTEMRNKCVVKIIWLEIRNYVVYNIVYSYLFIYKFSLCFEVFIHELCSVRIDPSSSFHA